jgi:XapX domain-containing protein
MEMLLIGIALGLTIGFSCRWFDIPLPAPPNIVGALLVVAMTLGFVAADHVVSAQVPLAEESALHE